MVPIANDYFTIHQPPLLQVSWHPTAPFQLALLTMDNMIRFYSLADPELVILSLSLPSSPTAGVLHSMKDPVVAFGLWQNSAFILQEGGEVTLATLTQATPPPPPLLIHPQTDEDCDSEASSMLILPSQPCVVVIATTNGTVNHCVYLDDEEREVC